MRRIPATMATQHPDNANAPTWVKDNKPFISVYKEIEEAVYCFKTLGVSEYMWDWEGKHADAAVIDRLFSDYYEYFKQNQLGKEKFLTFRIPNIWEEKGYNLLQAMTVVLSGEDFARDLKFSNRPLFEVILPMTESADQLIHMQKLFKKLAIFKSKEFTADSSNNTDYLEIIPLVESVESQLNIDKLLNDYVKAHIKVFKSKPEYIRPFMARSDPALVSGSLSTVLANKIALSKVYEFAKKTGIKVYPISGVGSLPFRGGLTPATIDEYVDEYPGMRTASIQSSFRYDSSQYQVKAAIDKLEKLLPQTKPKIITKPDRLQLESIISNSTKNYQNALASVVIDLKEIFTLIPKRRDRRQHIGLLAYGRNMSGLELPRAITFTAGFYSVGVPPEFLGLGKTLKKLTLDELVLVKNNYKYIISDIVRAGKFLNKANLKQLSKTNSAWLKILDDIEIAENILDVQFGPSTPDEKTHAELSSELLKTTDKDNKVMLIEEMAIMRRSLG